MSGMKALLGDTPFEDHYPQSPGHRDMATSRAAAVSMKGTAKRLQDECLRVLATREMTADEVAITLGVHLLAIRPRITELNKEGKIKTTGYTRLNASGRKASVWRVTRLP